MMTARQVDLRGELLEAKAKLAGLMREKLRRQSQDSMLAFTRFTKPDYQINWHHQVLCQYLDKFARGEIKRLMIFMPPRNGKSELVSRRLPAFILGRNPDAQIISCSYSADLAGRMNRDVQRIIDDDSFRSVFPRTELYDKGKHGTSQSFVRTTELFEVVGHRGVYRSAGVGGGITGMGLQFGIIDDPVKNQDEADSSVYREKHWEWFTSTFYTRLEKDASICLTLTRWHEDDIAGRLLAQAKANPKADQWVVINFPALCEKIDEARRVDLLSQGYQLGADLRAPGQALWPWKYPSDTLTAIEAVVGPRVWNALYQQRPSAEEGNVVQNSWWKFYQELPTQFDRQLQSWDMTFKDTKGSDFVVGQVWGQKAVKKYLLDQLRGRWNFPATLDKVRELAYRWPDAYEKFIEDKANGPAVMAQLENEIEGMIAIEPDGSKYARANAVAYMIRAGDVMLPEPSQAPWVVQFLNEWRDFKPGCAHDDQVDACTQALNQMREGGNILDKLTRM